MEKFVHKFANLLLKSRSGSIVLPPVLCYVSKIFPREDVMEVCDRSFSIKVKFEPMENLKAIVMSQPFELNILGLIGKQLYIQTSEMRF